VLFASAAQASLKVLTPAPLVNYFETSEIKSEISNYGFYQKDTSRLGKLIIPKTKLTGCEELKREDFDPEQLKNQNPMAGYFLMLERGECSFPQKIENAQNFGATAVIISDYNEAAELGSTKTMTPNDGTLRAHIPAIEVEYQHTKTLKKFYAMGETIYLNLNMDWKPEDNNVEVDLWYSSSLDLGMKLANEFSALSYSFTNDHAKKPLFTPRVATYSCQDCSQEIKDRNCVSDGAYCAYTPKFVEEYGLSKPDSNFSLTGREIMIQSLREKCLHQLISDKYKSEGVLFWTMFHYLEKCFVDEGVQAKSLDDCYDWSTVIIDGNEEVSYINDCVRDSFKGSDETMESDNLILRADREWAEKFGLKLHPSIIINGHTYYGDVTGQNLALAICDAYKEAPDECELSWKIKVFQEGLVDDIDDVMLPEQEDFLYKESIASSSSQRKFFEQQDIEEGAAPA
jgi:hypothetical protein